MRFYCLLPILLVTGVLIGAVGNARAQDDIDISNAARWFQIEVIIFSPTQSGFNTSEILRKDFKLDYPAQWLVLRPPLAPEELAQAADDDGLNQPRANTGAGDQTVIDNSTQANSGDSQQPGIAEDNNNSIFSTAVPENNPFGLDDTNQADSVNLDERYILRLLPDADLELAEEAKQISNNRYRILFHGGWRQGLFELPQSPGIIITGGERFGDHFELEGSLTFSVSTYLRVDANIWLTRFANNFGQEQLPWPNLPVRPDLLLTKPIDTQQPVINLDWNNFATFNSEYDAILAKPFITEEIVRLKQTRYRMRSTELHYIDHPRLGMLVKILPYENPEEGSSASSTNDGSNETFTKE